MRLVHGDFMMTYDDSTEVIALAQDRGFAVRGVPMKNTHHATMQELLILPTKSDSTPALVRASA